MEKETIKAYMAEVEEIRYYNLSRTEKLCRILITEGKKSKDDKVRAFGEYYLTEVSYRSGKLDDRLLNRAIRTLRLCKRCGQHELECRCYNMLGIYLSSQGDNVTAVEYYQAGVAAAKKYRYGLALRMLMNNIGDLYLMMGDYTKALYYLERAYQQALLLYKRKTTKEKIRPINVNVCLLNLAELYYRLGQYEECLRRLELLLPEENEVTDGYYMPSAYSFYALCYHQLGQEEKCRFYIGLVHRATQEENAQVDSMRDYQIICELMLECGEMKKAEEMVAYIRKIAERSNIGRVWCDYYETSISFLKKTGDSERLLATYEEYFRYKKQLNETERQQKLRAVYNREALNRALLRSEQMEKHNAMLQDISEHDALTGLLNRYAMNSRCEKWFRNAQERQESIGIIILDVDYFKQYNDTYGHLGGDECLKEVSMALKEASGSKDMLIRYGGDEFFVLTKGKTTQEMLALALRINENTAERRLEHKASKVSCHVTLTQGIVNGVPEEMQSMFDLIHCADNALYCAKEKGRGSVCVYGGEDRYQVYRFVEDANELRDWEDGV